MRSHYITTIYGPDYAGIVKSLAQATRGLGGEWLSSKVIKLEGRFAAIMSVVVDEADETSLKEGLAAQFPELSFSYSIPGKATQEATKTINLMVDCIDRPGLTADLSNILANFNIAVEGMDCKRYAMDGIRDMVFSAKMTLSVPIGADSEAIAGEIEALSEDVRVNVL